VVAARRWQSGRGVVSSSELGFRDEDNVLRIRYEYVVERFPDQTFQGTTPRACGGAFRSEEDRRALVARFPAGSPVDVFYDPRNPRRSCLDRSDMSAIELSKDAARVKFTVGLGIIAVIVLARMITPSPVPPYAPTANPVVAAQVQAAPLKRLDNRLRLQAGDQRRPVKAMNGTSYFDLGATAGPEMLGILGQQFRLSPGNSRDVLVRDVDRTIDGRDKLLIELSDGSLLLVWADELELTIHERMDPILDGSRVDVDSDVGTVIARHDSREGQMPARGFFQENLDLLTGNDSWDKQRQAASRPSPLLEALGIDTTSARRHLVP
jgi:hypothetical protein